MIGRWFGRLPSFGDKVSWLVTLTSGVAILAVCFLLALIEYANLRRETLASLQAQTMLVAMNSGAPLAFADRYSAAEALDAFRARQAVASATLYDVGGTRFASYRRATEPPPVPLPVAFTERWVHQVTPVEDRGQMLGRIEVTYDLREMQAHLWRSLLLSALVSLAAVVMVYLFSLRIKHVLVEPIAQLGKTVQKVSETKDYSLRAQKVSEDELGVFTDSFNQMLEQIQKQDLEIQASRLEAVQASQLKDEFLATLSHELRTPMTPILGWAQILQRSSQDPGKVLQAAEVIERNARAQNRIVDDLLDMSRIISGKVRLDVRLVDLAGIVDAALDTVAAAADARGIRLEKDLEPVQRRVRADPHRLQQVLWNLLSNAIKFTGTGGLVCISVRRADTHVEISVRDTGQGIAENFLPHVFERFRQADSSNTRQHAGLGLGLAIVKELVELHGGSVRAESPGSGQGATFTVSLPAAAPVGEDAGPAPPGRTPFPAVKPQTAELAGLRVLLVDDESDARDLIEDMLRGAGARVVSAGSAEEALRRFAQAQPDALLSDIGMPGESGYDLIRQVRALPIEAGGGVPAIAITAFARPEDRSRALAAGFQLHLSKPIEQGELFAALSSLTARKTHAG
jgi:signal transduction histidine kinase/ActR/RegA family two-component response regulator